MTIVYMCITHFNTSLLLVSRDEDDSDKDEDREDRESHPPMSEHDHSSSDGVYSQLLMD